MGKRYLLVFLLTLSLSGYALCPIPPFETSGKQIVDRSGNPVRLVGVNWFGFETETHVVHGLWKRNMRDLVLEIKSLGFNLLRIPFSNEILKPKVYTQSVDYYLNPTLRGLTSLEVLDRLVAEAEREGLYVLLDRHSPEENSPSALWYTDEVPETKWIEDWIQLAKRYRGNPYVIGFDLHNEPHDPATWAGGDVKKDWNLAAERAGNAILNENPALLIFVEGVQSTLIGSYWWGGNLAEAERAPVRLNVANRLVYSTHDYPLSVAFQPWFFAPLYPGNLPLVWEQFWGYLLTKEVAPVFLGEFGSKLETQVDTQWLDSLVDYVRDRQMSFAFWSLNPNSTDTGGIFKDDWETVEEEKIIRLRRAMVRVRVKSRLTVSH